MRSRIFPFLLFYSLVFSAGVLGADPQMTIVPLRLDESVETPILGQALDYVQSYYLLRNYDAVIGTELVWSDRADEVDPGKGFGEFLGASDSEIEGDRLFLGVRSSMEVESELGAMEIVTLWSFFIGKDGEEAVSPDFRVIRIIGAPADPDFSSLMDDFRRQWSLTYPDDSVVQEVLGGYRFVLARTPDQDYYRTQHMRLLDSETRKPFGWAVVETLQEEAAVCRVLQSSRKVKTGDSALPFWGVGLKSRLYGSVLLQYSFLGQEGRTTEEQVDGNFGFRQYVTRDMYRAKPYVSIEGFFSEYYHNALGISTGVEVEAGIVGVSFRPAFGIGILLIPDLDWLVSHVYLDVDLGVAYKIAPYAEIDLSVGYKGGLSLSPGEKDLRKLTEEQTDYLRMRANLRYITLQLGYSVYY